MTTVLVAWALLYPAHGLILEWDEADYLNASRLGLVANAWERGSLGPRDFVSFVQSKRRGEAPAYPAGYTESSDPVLLRHHHPPLVIYLMTVLPAGTTERSFRVVQSLGAMALVLMLFFAHAVVSPRSTWPGLLIVSALSLWATRTLFASVSLHGWMAVWIAMSSCGLALWFRHRRLRHGVLAAAATGLACLTLETGFLLIVLHAAVVLFADSNVRFRARAVTLAAGLVMVSLVVVLAWPGGFTTLGWAKIAALHVYRLKQGNEYATAGIGGMFVSLLPALAAGIWGVVALVRRRNLDRAVLIFAVTSTGYFLVMSRVALSTTYLAPALALSAALAGAAGDLATGFHRRLVLPVLLLLFAPGVGQWGVDPIEDAHARAEMRQLGTWPPDREILADGAHIYQEYAGRPIRPVSLSYDERSLMQRRGGVYAPVESQDLAGRLLVVPRHRSRFLESPVDAVKSCSRIDQRTLVVFDCPPR